MTTADPQEGSFCYYAGKAFGRWARFASAWNYWSTKILIMGSQLTALSILTKFWFPDIPYGYSLPYMPYYRLPSFCWARKDSIRWKTSWPSSKQRRFSCSFCLQPPRFWAGYAEAAMEDQVFRTRLDTCSPAVFLHSGPRSYMLSTHMAV